MAFIPEREKEGEGQRKEWWERGSRSSYRLTLDICIKMLTCRKNLHLSSCGSDAFIFYHTFSITDCNYVQLIRANCVWKGREKASSVEEHNGKRKLMCATAHPGCWGGGNGLSCRATAPLTGTGERSRFISLPEADWWESSSKSSSGSHQSPLFKRELRVCVRVCIKAG